MQPDDVRVVDILSAAGEIADYITGKSFEAYTQTSLLRAGGERQVYIIGEAVRQLSPEFKDRHPTIPWTKIVGARNVLAHEYGRINHEIIWKVATIDVPSLAEYLTPIAPNEVEE